jgi:hypothetical protein
MSCAICGSTDRMAAEGPRNNSRRITIKEMANALGWLLGASVAVLMWLLVLWVERTHGNRQERKNGDTGRPPTPPRRS